MAQLNRIARTLKVCIVVMVICAAINLGFFAWGVLAMLTGLPG